MCIRWAVVSYLALGLTRIEYDPTHLTFEGGVELQGQVAFDKGLFGDDRIGRTVEDLCAAHIVGTSGVGTQGTPCRASLRCIRQSLPIVRSSKNRGSPYSTHAVSSATTRFKVPSISLLTLNK